MIRSSIRPLLVLATAAALTLATAPGALPAPGDLDTSFGRSGKVVTDVTKRGDGVNAVAITSTGRIVVAGTSKDGARFAIAQYRTDGSLDRTFGDHGIVQTNVTDANDVLHGVAVQPDGEIVVAGQAGTGPRFVVARYTADGVLDPTFGGDGMVSTSFEAKGGDAAVAVAVLPDGEILAAGVAHTNCSCERYAVARYDTDGRLDRTFGTDGKATVHFRSGGEPGAMAVAADGSIVLVGGNVPDVDKFQVTRFTADGAIDTTFGGGDGKVTTNTGQGEEAATGVAIDRGGSVIVIGYTDLPHEGGETFGPSKFALVRYAGDGSLDRSFRTNGRVKTAFSTDAFPHGVVVQADGKIVAVGGVGTRFGLVRYATDGTLDPTFGGDGKVTTNLSSDVDDARAIALQEDGRIVVAGTASGVGRGAFALVRYLAA
ncbi:MAG: hypothetical protein ACXVPX_03685 [Actinomycetota bacterium]